MLLIGNWLLRDIGVATLTDGDVLRDIGVATLATDGSVTTTDTGICAAALGLVIVPTITRIGDY